MNPFQYQRKIEAFHLTPEKANGHWQRYGLEFPVVAASSFTDAKPGSGYYYQPQGSQKYPAVILLHGWGDRSSLPFLKLAADLATQGIAAVFLYTPFHARRAPRYLKRKGTHLFPPEWFTGYQIMVTDILHTADWLRTRDEIDAGRLGIIGLSLGAFISSIALSIDPELKAGVLFVSGGNAGKIAHLSRFKNFRKEYALPDDVYAQNQRDYYAYLEKVKTSGWQNIAAPQPGYYTDALTYAHLLKNKPVLMLNALWDEFVPREATLEFWQAAGKPQIEWFPATHPTIWAFYPRIQKMVGGFLQQYL